MRDIPARPEPEPASAAVKRPEDPPLAPYAGCSPGSCLQPGLVQQSSGYRSTARPMRRQIAHLAPRTAPRQRRDHDDAHGHRNLGTQATRRVDCPSPVKKTQEMDASSPVAGKRAGRIDRRAEHGSCPGKWARPMQTKTRRATDGPQHQEGVTTRRAVDPPRGDDRVGGPMRRAVGSAAARRRFIRRKPGQKG